MMELEARPFSTTKLVEATEQSAWLGWGSPFSQILPVQAVASSMDPQDPLHIPQNWRDVH